MVLDASARTTAHWGSRTNHIRFFIFTLFFFNTFVNIPSGIASTVITFNNWRKYVDDHGSFQADHDYTHREGNHARYLDNCGGSCIPGHTAWSVLVPAVWVLLFNIVDLVLLLRFNLHSSYTLPMSLLTCLGLLATVPMQWVVYGEFHPRLLTGVSLWCAIAQGILAFFYLYYTVLSCIGVHNHRTRNSRYVKDQVEQDVREEVERQHGGRPWDLEDAQKARGVAGYAPPPPAPPSNARYTHAPLTELSAYSK